jgi:hypothetical protein
VDEVVQIWGRGRLFIGQLEICPLETTYPKNSGLGAEMPGFHLRRKFRPHGNFHSENSGQKFRPFTEGCTTVWKKGLSENSKGQKFWNFRPSEILVTQNFRPLPASCTTAFCKGLSRFFEGRKLWNFRPLKILPNQNFPAPSQSIAPQRFVKDLAEFRRAGNSPGNFV